LRQDIFDLGKAFGAQQLVGNVLRSNANAGIQLQQPQLGHLGRRLGSERQGRADQAGRAGQ
jgi:hypothetical protein